ncbi:hypothetical protein AV530_015656 [Patagioenas fasciata monilis]|uniref:Uncharacterized protein n=1 Tax=Patagioenas fasciata monilis TaxID=372326 RepID=A0A1V4KII0_PATFA|nr:hypothetical protein AV530_015656 [Patagioenas fasciata monilis]
MYLRENIIPANFAMLQGKQRLEEPQSVWKLMAPGQSLMDVFVCITEKLLAVWTFALEKVFPGLCILLHICTSVPSVETFVL